MMLPENRRQARMRWIGGAGAAIAGHAVVVAGLLLDVNFGNPRPTLAAMVVDLAPIATAVAAPVTEIPPGPPKIESRPQPKPLPMLQRPPFDPPPEIKWDTPPEVLVEQQKPQEQEELLNDQPPAETTTAMSSLAAPPDDKSVAPREGSSSDASANAERTWESTLLAHLERNKRYPSAAQRRRQEDVIYVRFAIDRAGKVLEYAIERSRGYPLLDQEVAELVARSSPLPAPPEEVAGERVELVVPVEFFLRKMAHNN